MTMSTDLKVHLSSIKRNALVRTVSCKERIPYFLFEFGFVVGHVSLKI